MLGATYSYDLAGNMIGMPHLPTIGWDERGRLASGDQLGGGIVYDRYDSRGGRVRNVQARSVAAGQIASYERIYFDEYEVYRELDAAGNATKEIESVHGLDGAKRRRAVSRRVRGRPPAELQQPRRPHSAGARRSRARSESRHPLVSARLRRGRANGCHNLGDLLADGRDAAAALAAYVRACDLKLADGCHLAAGLVRTSGHDAARAAELDRRACQLGLAAACR